jgi:MFS transporter, MHS family, shikimate and dehydroshikimate transport protein
MASASAQPQVGERSIMKIALTSLAGSSIEWYDFFIFGTAAALFFPDLFFPGAAPFVGTLLAFATFGVAFFARPLGGVLWGHFGDRVGRKKALVSALMAMGIATTLIGLLPTYAQIGAAAPIILVILRFIQGLAVGGQWGGAVLIATESAPREKRGFYGSFAQVGVPVGVILSNAAFLIIFAALGPEAQAAWGWRIPFLLSFLLIGVGLYVQLRLEETPAFQHLQEQSGSSGESDQSSRQSSGSPIIEAFRRFPKQIFLAAGAFIVVNATFYIFIVYIIGYGENVLGLPQSVMLTGVLLASIVQIPALMGFAALSDRLGRRIVYLSGAALLGLWAFPFFLLVNTESSILIWIALIVGQTFLSMMYGPQAALLSEMFSTELRYSGASLGYQIGAVFGGALAPIIAASLLEATGSAYAISAYMLAIAIISFVCVIFITETYQTDVDEVEAQKRQTADAKRDPAPG